VLPVTVRVLFPIAIVIVVNFLFSAACRHRSALAVYSEMSSSGEAGRVRTVVDGDVGAANGELKEDLSPQGEVGLDLVNRYMVCRSMFYLREERK
jgi:hypothetical protein